MKTAATPTPLKKRPSVGPSFRLTPMAIFVGAVFATGLSTSAFAAPTPKSVQTQLTAITKTAVKGRRVDYAAVNAKRAALTALIGDIANAKVGASKTDRLAFYINAYNAHVLTAVLHEGLVSGGKSTGKGVLDVPGFFDKKTHTTAGRTTTLNVLEEKFIRNEKDPRIHFVVNCASVDCPPLRATAYSGKTLDAALDQQSRAYLTRKGAVVFDDAKKEVRVVKLFEWYAKDFGGDEGVRKFLNTYLKDARVLNYKLVFHEYNWKLNATQ